MVFLLLLGSPARPAAVLALTRVPRDLDRGRVDLNPPGPLQLKKRRPEVSMPNSPRPWIMHAPAGPPDYWCGCAPRQWCQGSWARGVVRVNAS